MVSLNSGGPHTSATAGALQDFCLETGDQTEQVLNLNLQFSFGEFYMLYSLRKGIHWENILSHRRMDRVKQN